MAVISLKLLVGNLETVRSRFTHLKVYRAPSLTGTYVEITDGSTRIPFEDGKTVYPYIDENSPEGAYYKSSYYNTTSGLESSLSEAQQGENDPALDIVSITELKTNYLFGLDLTNDAGEDMPDTLYAWFIQSAVSWLEHKLDLPLRPAYYEDERHDYYREDYPQWIWLELHHYPVLDIEELKMVLPGDETSQVFDSSWIHLKKESGQVQVVPGNAGHGSILFGGAGVWHPFLRGGHRMIPDVFRVKYTAGFETFPEVLRDIVGKIAAFGPLNIAGDLLGGAGIASQTISMDGLSQTFNTTSSATNAGYGARLLQYQKEIKEVVPTLHRYYKGARIKVV